MTKDNHLTRITIDLDEPSYRRMKIKVAQDGLLISELVRAMLADYSAGKWVPKSAAKEKPVDQ